MHAALSSSRLQTPKSALRATYSPDTGRVRVLHPRGTHFRTMGTAVKKGGVAAGGVEGGEGGAGVVMLKEEEALYLVERGALELRFEGKRGEGDGNGGVGNGEGEYNEEGKEGIGETEKETGKAKKEELGLPMSVQAAYTFLIGAGHGLTLERFIVYAGLKRSGYIVLRAPGWDGEEDHTSRAGGKNKKKNEPSTQIHPQPLGWFSRIYAALWKSLAFGGQQRQRHHRPGAGPLVGLGVYRSYSQYYYLYIQNQSSLHAHRQRVFWFSVQGFSYETFFWAYR